jgi:voltage-gated sodium channel
MLAASVPQLPSFEKSSVGFVRRALWRLVHQYGYAFDLVMGVVIIANSIIVGLEIQWDLQGRDNRTNITRQLEHLFLAVFVVELIIRALADGPKALRCTWFKFDALLVSIGVVSSWIVAPIMGQVNSDGNAFLDVLSQLLILRILRLLRLVRALRLFEQFQEMWKLANGLLCSLRTVLSACILILMTVYMFACLGIELISRNTSLQEDPVTAEVIQTHFRSLPMAMLTLCQFASADSIAIVYTPLVERVWYLGFYFSAVWLVVTVCLMNLITAVIVDKAIAQGGMDREMEAHLLRKKMRAYAPCINAVFADMDKSGDGQLHLSEVKYGLEHIERRIPDLPEDLQRVFGSDQLIDLFEFLDTDGSGAIDEQEFLDGVSHLVLQSIPIETTQTLNLLRSQSKMLSMIVDSAHFQGDLAFQSPGRGVPTMPHLPISSPSRAVSSSAKPNHLCIRVGEPSDQARPMDL